MISPDKKRLKVRVDKLKSHPLQAEVFELGSEESLAELAESIDREGMQTPPEITKDYVLICGHRRVEAARRLGWTHVDVKVRHDLQDEAAIQRRLLEDNVVRRQMDPIEIARSYQTLMEISRREGRRPGEGGDLRDVLAKKLGKSGRTLDRYVQVLRTPLAVQRAVTSNELTLSQAISAERLSKEVQQEIATRIEAGEPAKSVVREYIAPKPSLHQVAGDAMAAFVRSLKKGLDDLDGRVGKIRSSTWQSDLPKLKQAKKVIGQLIRQIEQAE